MIITEANRTKVLDAIDNGNYTLKHIKLALPDMWAERINASLKVLTKDGILIRFKVGQEAGYCRPSDAELVAHKYRCPYKTFLKKYCAVSE